MNQTLKPNWTPWGNPQTVVEIADGIVWYTTAGHGGCWLSDERLAQLSPALRAWQSFTGPNWYEEDCDWVFPFLCFAEEFFHSTSWRLLLVGDDLDSEEAYKNWLNAAHKTIDLRPEYYDNRFTAKAPFRETIEQWRCSGRRPLIITLAGGQPA